MDLLSLVPRADDITLNDTRYPLQVQDEAAPAAGTRRLRKLWQRQTRGRARLGTSGRASEGTATSWFLRATCRPNVEPADPSGEQSARGFPVLLFAVSPATVPALARHPCSGTKRHRYARSLRSEPDAEDQG